MTTDPGSPPPSLVRMSAADTVRLRTGATVVATDPTLFRIEGPGAADCLQGLLTSDVIRQGPDSIGYGAMLTPRGMIVVDLWVLRDGGGFTLVAVPEGRAAGHDLFHRLLPPRLARVHDRTGQWGVLWLLGERAERVLSEAGLPCPPRGKTVTEAVIPGPVIVARAEGNAPFQALLTLPHAALPSWRERLVAAGATEGGPDHLEAARILAGWPRLGFEITEKTLPQEVRYDAIGGVSYTKGCYVGQETVARVHFRGHPNRELRGLTWAGAIPADLSATTGGREVGVVRSVLQLEERGFGLALLRREVADGEEVRLGTTLARVEPLPFG